MGDASAACRHVFSPVLELSIFQHRQALVGNGKALSANLSLAEKNLLRSLSRIAVLCLLVLVGGQLRDLYGRIV